MRLKITLKSDLCAASGAGFSAVIDTDSCFDQYGLPYIPARRLKGCLREAADLIETDQNIINCIFGNTACGFGESGLLRISDAHLEGYKEFRKEIAEKKISAENVMNLFGDIRSATAIENDTAKKNSLRFTRVISKLSPFDASKELEFYSDIELDADNDTIEAFENCCKALRNIGYRRNRGLGSVICTLLPDESFEVSEFKELSIPDSINPDAEYTIDIAVNLKDDLMIPQGSGTVSVNYIPGAMVLGAVAAMHIKATGENNSTDFNDIFFSGKVSFGNLYICDKYGAPSFPAPLHIGKVKRTKEIVNMFSYKEKEIVKSLKDKFLSPYAEAKVSAKTVYHHSRVQQTLYTQDCIDAGQRFEGTIICSGEYAKHITNLLSCGTISFGRSKNAQYSRCDIIKLICKESTISETVTSSKSDYMAAVLRSDLIIDVDGDFSDKTVFEAVFADTGLLGKVDLTYSSLLSGTVSGYNSKWNLKRPHCSCIKAGSVLIFSCNADENINMPRFINIGMRQNEGFGRFEILPDADCPFEFKPFTDADKDITCSGDAISHLMDEMKKKDRLLDAAIEASKEAVKYQLPNPSLIGRATLMAKEALLVKNAQWANFEGRIKSIKSEGNRKKTEKLISILDKLLTKDNSDCKRSSPNSEKSEFTDCDRLKAFIYYMNIIKYLNRLEKDAKPQDGGAK